MGELQPSTIFTDLNINPEEGAEILGILGASFNDLNDNSRFNKIREIINFFQGKENKRFLINRIMKPGVDRIDHAFEYVMLERELDEKIMSLQDFNELFSSDINDDIENGFIPNNKLDIMEEQLDTFKIERMKAEKIKSTVQDIKQLIRNLDLFTG